MHTYLHYQSAHPIHQEKSSPYSQLIRVRRICTYFKDFVVNAKIILAYYKLRGYSKQTLEEAFQKASSLDRTVLLIPKDDQLDEISNDLFLVMTYNPANPEVKKALQENWHLIQQERSLSPLHNTDVKVGFR